MRKIHKLLFLCATHALVSSCGKELDEKDKDSAEMEEAGDLQTGTNFLNAPRTYVKFRGLRAGQPKTKLLHFSAPADGTLTMDASALGIGIGCDGDSNNKIAVRYEFQQRATDGSFSRKPEKANPDFHSAFEHRYSLKRGDQLLIKLVMVPALSCDSGEVGIMAVFD
jgi:hypothetical protein